MSFVLLNKQTISEAQSSTVNFATLRTPSCANIEKQIDNPVRRGASGQLMAGDCMRCSLYNRRAQSLLASAPIYFGLTRRKNGEIRKDAAEDARERVRKTGVFSDMPLCDSRNTI